MGIKNNILVVCSACAITSAATSCGSIPDNKAQTERPGPYFSLENYFQQEASRLQQHAPQVFKTVTKDGSTEQRNIQIADWNNELALFIDSDINKADWRNSYKIDSTQTSVLYTSLDRSLRTKKITIEKYADNGVVKYIGVTNQTRNMLYQTDEQLDYYPDSLYRISKRQSVRIIGESNYTITGTFQ